MPIVAEAQQAFLDQFADLETRVASQALHQRRREAMESFREKGFPGEKDEAWKYTSLRAIKKTTFLRPEAMEPDSKITRSLGIEYMAGIAPHRLFFVNGRFAPELSTRARLPLGVRIRDLASLLSSPPTTASEHLTTLVDLGELPLAALNTAFLEDGAFVHVERGAQIAEPLALIFATIPGSSPIASFPRVLIVSDANSRAAILEIHTSLPSGSPSWSNAVTEIAVGSNAFLDHYKLVHESTGAFHTGLCSVVQGRDSRFVSHSFSLGGALVRNDLHVKLAALGTDCQLNGLYLATGRQHVDNHTSVEHAVPHGRSQQIYRGVLDDKSVAVFDGKVLVRPNAQKTLAQQKNQNLLLSDQCLIHTKPELQIFADDVKCHHGATVGELDRDALFYLRSRGIEETAARHILTHAFASEILDRVMLPALKKHLEERLYRCLRRTGEESP